MKKLLFLLLALLLAVSPALAEDTAVYVSITDDTGALALAYAPVTVTDADADGVLSIADALCCAHAAYHPDGENAFLAEPTEFGISMVMLWGVDNGGSYGYYLNHASPMSLLDPVSAGDHVKAYAYTDLSAWSDTYCYFDADTRIVQTGAEVSLALTASGYDANFAPIAMPVSGAMLTVNGVDTAAVTDAEGKAVLTFAESGVYTVSARSETMTLIAPVCIVTAE